MFRNMMAASANEIPVDSLKSRYIGIKRIVLCSLVLFCLGNVSYGQGPWSSEGWRGPRPRGAVRIASEAAKRAWEIGSAQVQQAYRERWNEQRRYDAAVRREWEANRRAAYQERVSPSSWQAESLRQAANQASMERARAEAVVRLRAQNDRRLLYGNRFTTTPTRQQWVRPSSVNNRPSLWPQDRPVTDRERAAISARERASARATDAYRAYDKAVREGRDPSVHVREFDKASMDFVTHAFESTEVGRDAAARNAAREKAANGSRQSRESTGRSEPRDRAPNDSRQPRESSTSDKQSWQDRQREQADRRP